jgi:uncharacterized protein
MRTETVLLMLLAVTATAACRESPSTPKQPSTTNPSTPHNESASAPLPRVTLRITRSDGSIANFSAEVALDKASQETGLTGRSALARDSAMIFPFERLTPASFWMKGTTFPLDHLFVQANGMINAILPGKPNDLTPISTGEAVIAVIQIAGGQAKAQRIEAGATVSWGQCPGAGDRPPEAWDRLAFCR